MLFGLTSSRDIWGWGRISGVWAEASRLHPRWTQVAEEMLLMFGRKPNQHDDMEERPSFEGHKLTCFLHPLGKCRFLWVIFVAWHMNQVIGEVSIILPQSRLVTRKTFVKENPIYNRCQTDPQARPCVVNP